MNRARVKQTLMACKTYPQGVEDCVECPNLDGKPQCIARMVSDALDIIEADERAIKALAEYIKAEGEAARMAVDAINGVMAGLGIE